jgi:hypothetical protein
MDTDQTTGEKINILHQRAKTLLSKKMEEEQVIAELVKEGIDEGYANLIIENVKDEISDKKNFRKELTTGLYLTIGGLLLNLGSYIFSENTGNIFFIAFWSIVASGITIIIRAFVLFKR